MISWRYGLVALVIFGFNSWAHAAEMIYPGIWQSTGPILLDQYESTASGESLECYSSDSIRVIPETTFAMGSAVHLLAIDDLPTFVHVAAFSTDQPYERRIDVVIQDADDAAQYVAIYVDGEIVHDISHPVPSFTFEHDFGDNGVYVVDVVATMSSSPFKVTRQSLTVNVDDDGVGLGPSSQWSFVHYEDDGVHWQGFKQTGSIAHENPYRPNYIIHGQLDYGWGWVVEERPSQSPWTNVGYQDYLRDNALTQAYHWQSGGGQRYFLPDVSHAPEHVVQKTFTAINGVQVEALSIDLYVQNNGQPTFGKAYLRGNWLWTGIIQDEYARTYFVYWPLSEEGGVVQYRRIVTQAGGYQAYLNMSSRINDWNRLYLGEHRLSGYLRAFDPPDPDDRKNGYEGDVWDDLDHELYPDLDENGHYIYLKDLSYLRILPDYSKPPARIDFARWLLIDHVNGQDFIEEGPHLSGGNYYYLRGPITEAVTGYLTGFAKLSATGLNMLEDLVVEPVNTN